MAELIAIILASLVGAFFVYSRARSGPLQLPPRKHDPRFTEERMQSNKKELEADIDRAMESRQSADDLLQEARDAWEQQR